MKSSRSCARYRIARLRRTNAAPRPWCRQARKVATLSPRRAAASTPSAARAACRRVGDCGRRLVHRDPQCAGGEVQAQLDLRPYALMRSETPADRAPLPLPRGRLTLTMILPVGFEPGAYKVQLLDSELASRASAAGTATSENFVTTLQTTLDLSSVSRGAYQLAVRRTGEEWQLFPADVR